MPDHQKSKHEKEMDWIREQVSQIVQQRIALDNMFQQIAALARLSKIKPEHLVKASQDVSANYTYLSACMKEEQRLQEEAMAKAKEVADQLAINNNNDHGKTQENTTDSSAD
jgi:hypothetical protein